MAYNAQAASDPRIRIDGELRSFKPSAMIVNGRTMVPVRFIIEDESLKGQVYWDGNQQKVAMDVRGKYIEFFIGSRTAKVDGEKITLDTAPYIYQDRTYIPVRFLAESLGAAVSWDNASRIVNIEFNYRPEVFAYYYYTPWQELSDNIGLFSDIAFRWYQTNARGELSFEYDDNYQKVLQYVQGKGVRTHASVVYMDSTGLHTLLSSSANRSLLIGNLLDAVKKYNYDGVNIDFEFIKSSDADYFTLFLKELKASLGPNLDLSVAVFARTEADKWATPYQYAEIGKIADKVVVMSYDYHYKTSAAGAVAPLWWLENVSNYMTARIPADKILLGMATYGYDWSSDGTAKTITASKLAAIKSKYSVTEHFDTASQSPYFTYWDEYGNSHQIWMENERSLSEKWNTAVSRRVGGISFWRIGNGFDDLYRVLKNNGM